MIERSLTVVTAAATDPVTLAEAKAHLRVTSSTEDALITSLVSAATQYAQAHAGRQYVTATLKQSMPYFPTEIELLRPPLQSTTVTLGYTDSNGSPQTLASTEYQVDKTAFVGRIKPAYDKSWPATREGVYNAVEVTYTAGYGAAATVPQVVKQAIYLLVGHWYEHREAILTGTISKAIELAVDALLSLDRVIEA